MRVYLPIISINSYLNFIKFSFLTLKSLETYELRFITLICKYKQSNRCCQQGMGL